ncbi:MAG: hypothetical protein R2764_12465 [Bacteroidales bacterium]
MKKYSFFLATIVPLLLSGQQPMYFNNIYNNNGFNTKGYSIIDDGNGYVGYGLTKDENVYQLLFFYKYSYEGVLEEFKTFYEPYHEYYAGNIGGAMKQSVDGNYYFAYHLDYGGSTYGRLMKMDQNLDTIWTKYYLIDDYLTMPWNSNTTYDQGFIIIGSAWESGIDLDILLIKTDSLGNHSCNSVIGGEWAEQGTNVVQTPDGGYLIGGYFWKPGIDHSLDAMVVKTDSLGNEEWTKYYGNPDVDDDMAFVALANDGNYLVATVYGEYIWTNEERAGRIYLIKIDENGDIVWENKMGRNRCGCYEEL